MLWKIKKIFKIFLLNLFISIGKANQVSKSSLLQELLECPICMNLYDAPTGFNFE
jgi:hypothetical protein